jgi:hypothetical protein
MQFEKLDDIWLQYLEDQQKGEHSWEKGLLHVSDLCSCPRMVGMRLLEMEKRPMTRPEKWKKLNMFYLANHLHDQQYQAWGRAGILIEKELSIRGYLPEGWTGRFDAIINYGGGMRIADIKTVAYLAKRATYPYIKHIAQVVAYDYYVGSDFQLTDAPLLYYMQRDLSHQESVESVVTPNEQTQYFMQQEMQKINEMKAALPELPGVLPREMKYTGRKKKGEYQEISCVMNHSCSTNFCDYSFCSCEPDAGEDFLVAYRVGSDWVPTPDGEPYKEQIEEFIMGEEYDGVE